MKRTVTAILCLILTLGAFTSCAGCGKHPTDPAAKGHDYLPQWSTNATHHWHACSDKTCTAQIDRAEHTWGEATLVKEATIDSDGELKSVCTVCQRSKIEYVEFKNFESSFWADLAKASNYENYTLEENTTVGEVYASAIYSFTAETVYFTNVDVNSSEMTTEEVGEATAERLRSCYTSLFGTLIVLGEKCEFFPISRGFTSEETFDVTIDGKACKVSELMIELNEDHKVRKLAFVLTDAENNTTKYEINLRNYGTTVKPEY